MGSYILAFLSVVVVSLISLIGIFTISLKEAFLKKYIFVFISLAVGSLLGDAFLHIIPESLESNIGMVATSLYIILGIMVFFTLEKFLHWHHHGEDKNEPHVRPVGNLMLLSDGVHNFIDGVVIGVSFIVSIPVGIATTLAVILHEIPQEVGDFTVLLHAGYKKQKALWLNFLSALCAILGLLLAFLLGETGEKFSAVVLPIAAGGFIYIAIADLIPELHKTKQIAHSFLQVISVLLGVLIMLALLLIE